MRPARKGPENQVVPHVRVHLGLPFNEAGPQGAGKHRRRPTAG